MTKPLIAILLLFAAPVFATQAPQSSSAPGQVNTLPLTLNDVLRMMLENNLNVAVGQLPPQIAQSLIDTYFRPFDPTLHISATGTRGTTPSTSQLSGAPALLQLTHSYNIGIGQTLKTGTSYGVDVILNRSSSNNTFSLYNPSWVGQVRYSLTQHLLQNRGNIVNDHSIRIAQNNHQISESQFEQQMMDIVTQVQNTYWDYVYSTEDIKVKQESLQLAEKTLDDNRKRVAAGLLAPLEVVQSESQVASMQDALVVSTYSSLQSENQLKTTISSQADPGLVPAKLTTIDVLRHPTLTDTIQVSQAIQEALENRPEMKEARLALKNAEIDTNYTKNQTLPLLDLNAGYTQNGLGGVQRLRSALGATTITGAIPGGIVDALGQVLGADYKTYSFGFNLQIPLTNRAARGDYDRALGGKKLAQAQLDATGQQIALDVRNAMNMVEMNKAHIESAGKARELAQSALDAEQKKYDLGISTLFFVLQAQTNLAIAQTNEIQALVSYTKSLVALDRATGETLFHNHIEIEQAKPRIAVNTAD